MALNDRASDLNVGNEQQEWSARFDAAEQLIPLLGQLRRNKNVVTSIFGRLLVNVSETDIIKSHRYARRISGQELPVQQSLAIVRCLNRMDLGTASIDLGMLATRFSEDHNHTADAAEDPMLEAYLSEQLSSVVGTSHATPQTDVVLYGFGRIGRLLARILIARAALYNGPRLRAVVVRKNGEGDLIKRASLLRRDSVHGPFEGTITVDEENNILWANGTPIQFIYSNDPASVDYTEYGINNAIVVDNTGRWRDREGLEQHRACPGVARVVLTAPGKGDVKNVVYGVNHDMLDDGDQIVSAASCTTNAITPVLKVVNDKWGVDFGHVETVHSFTNDQNLIDNFHKGERRGRAATLNMVLTETGAAKAVAKALPEFAGKLTGNAIRVPTPDVSMAVLNLTLSSEVDRTEVNDYLRSVSLVSELRQQISYIESPDIVSTDLVGSTHAGVVDGQATIVHGKHLVLYVWYDNEFGYSNQVIRVVEELAGARPPVLPQRRSVAEL